MLNFINAVIAWIKRPVVERAVKTFIEATAAQAAVYTTVVPTTPGVKTSASISVGAAVLSVLWNSLQAWATNTKSARLDRIAAAIDAAVDARLAAQKVPGNTPSA